MKKLPQINFNISFDMGVHDILLAATSSIRGFKNSLSKEEVFSKELWENLLESDYFLPIFSELLFDNEELKNFLINNFREKIEKKIVFEIERDFQNLNSTNPDIKKTSLIYTRNATFFDFFGGEEETIKRFELNKFYKDGIFENIKKLDLDNLNLFLFASLINWDFNGAFYSDDCKRVIGCILDLNNFFDENESKKVFGDEILYKMIDRFDDFYFVLDGWGCFYINNYIEHSEKLKSFFENNKLDIIREFYYITGKIPWDFVKDCKELVDALDEEDLEEAIENEGYESFEEMCEESF